MRILAIALSLPLAACVVGNTDGTNPGDDGSGSDPGSGSNPGTGISGHITADTTWQGDVLLSGATTIDPGITVTVAASTNLKIAGVANLSIQGTLDVQGTSAGKVNIGPETGTAAGGFRVTATGTLKETYAVQTGVNITTVGGAKVIISDTQLSHASGDFLIMDGGDVNVQYSQFGTDNDTTHCNMHFGGTGNTISVTHSNVYGAPYGLMFYGGTGANFTFNNWDAQGLVAGTTHLDVECQPGVAGDFSNGFFKKGAPSCGAGTNITLNNLAASPLTDAGIRP